MMIETERMLLRPMVVGDARDVFEYSSEKKVGPNAGWKPHENINETLEIMQMIFMNHEGVFAIVDKKTNKVFGSIGLIDDPKRENEKAKMLGYAISEAYWGRGLMTEAAMAVIRFGFREMNLELISAYCYPHNIASKRVIEKCGFEYEGRLRLCEELYNGMVFDNECYSLLRE